MSTEVRVTSATGGRKGQKDERYDLLPPAQLRTIAAFYTTEYADAHIGGSFNELNQQLWWFWDGSDVDPETGFLRLVHVAFHALELLATDQRVHLPEQTEERRDTFVAFDGIPAEALRLLTAHYGRGAEKYTERDEAGNITHDGADNWRLGYDWRLSYAALNRHLWQHQSGQFLDEETGSPHLVAVVWHAITLLWFYENKPEFDTRTSTKQAREAAAASYSWVDESYLMSTEELYRRLGGPVVEEPKPQGPVYYISGPMTGMPEHNFPAFHAAAEYYRAQGITVINPAELPGEGDEHPWAWFLRRDLVAMLDGGTTHIVLLPGFSKSRGAQLEKQVAEALGITKLYHALELDTQREGVA